MPKLPPPTPLIQRFIDAVNAFNACQQLGDYQKLVAKFLHNDVIMDEVDSPFTRHFVKGNVINYLDSQQSSKLPRLWLRHYKIAEEPSPSDNATHAWVTGQAEYQDNSVKPPPPQPPPPPWPLVLYHFQFKRPDTNHDWLITIATARLI